MIPSVPLPNGIASIMSGPEKVAALLLAMGKPAAGRLLKHFDPIELRQITRSAAELGSISMETLEQLVEEFASHFATGADLRSSVDDFEQLFQGILPPEQITDIMSDVLGSSNRSLWDRVSAMPESVIASYLIKEHPQTAALILSKLNPNNAAKVMGALPRDLRNHLVRRLVSLKAVSDPVLRLLETKLYDELLLHAARASSGKPTTRIAEMINKMDREQTEDMLESLAETRPADAAFLRGLVFSFEDIGKLSQRDRAILFDKVPTERVVLALAGTDATFRDLVLSALAARARRLVENELSGSNAAPPRDVMAARRLIADTVLDLAQRGEIEIKSQSDA